MIAASAASAVPRACCSAASTAAGPPATACVAAVTLRRLRRQISLRYAEVAHQPRLLRREPRAYRGQLLPARPSTAACCSPAAALAARRTASRR